MDLRKVDRLYRRERDGEVTPVELPNERRFWFDPPFHNGQSALLHRQPDNMYRIDLQLGSDADPELENRPADGWPERST